MAEYEADVSRARGLGTGTDHIPKVPPPAYLELAHLSQEDDDLVSALRDPTFVIHVIRACAEGLLDEQAPTTTVSGGVVSSFGR